MLKPINQCLNAKIRYICQSVFHLDKLKEMIAPMLPDELADHVSVGSFVSGTLTLVAKDSATASVLRFIVPELRDKLRMEHKLFNLSSISIHIPSSHDASELLPKKKRSTKPPSNEACAAMASMAEQIKHTPLREALLHLATPDIPSHDRQGVD